MPPEVKRLEPDLTHDQFILVCIAGKEPRGWRNCHFLKGSLERMNWATRQRNWWLTRVKRRLVNLQAVLPKHVQQGRLPGVVQSQEEDLSILVVQAW